MRFSETRLDILKTGDGLELDIHIWEPDTPKAILLAGHGGLAHAGDYVTPALFFKKRVSQLWPMTCAVINKKRSVLTGLNNSLKIRMFF